MRTVPVAVDTRDVIGPAVAIVLYIVSAGACTLARAHKVDLAHKRALQVTAKGLANLGIEVDTAIEDGDGDASASDRRMLRRAGVYEVGANVDGGGAMEVVNFRIVAQSLHESVTGIIKGAAKSRRMAVRGSSGRIWLLAFIVS